MAGHFHVKMEWCIEQVMHIELAVQAKQRSTEQIVWKQLKQKQEQEKLVEKE